jgi:hypothetical protein
MNRRSVHDLRPENGKNLRAYVYASRDIDFCRNYDDLLHPTHKISRVSQVLRRRANTSEVKYVCMLRIYYDAALNQ